jgi:hypothetical protein
MCVVGRVKRGVKYKNSLISSMAWWRNFNFKFSERAVRAFYKTELPLKVGRF